MSGKLDARHVEPRRRFVAHVAQQNARLGIVKLEPVNVRRSAYQSVTVLVVITFVGHVVAPHFQRGLDEPLHDAISRRERQS